MARKNKIKLDTNTLLGVAAVIVIACAIVLIVVFYPSGESIKPAAVVNGDVITMGELDAQYEMVPSQYKAFITRASLLEGLINERLLLQECKKMGIEVSDEEVNSVILQSLELYGMTEEDFVELMESQGVTPDEVKESYRKKMAISKLLNETLSQDITVSVEEAREYYDSYPDMFVLPGNGTMGFEDVKEQIIMALAKDKEAVVVEQYISGLREGADVQVFVEGEEPDILFDIQPVGEEEQEAIEGELEAPVAGAVSYGPLAGSVAECLSAKGARLYGAGWSKNTQSQIEMLGDAFESIEYVDCAEVKCKEMGIANYPTWVIGGEKHTGEKSLEELAALAGC